MSHWHTFVPKIYINQNFGLCLTVYSQQRFLEFTIQGVPIYNTIWDLPMLPNSSVKFVLTLKRSSYKRRGKPFQVSNPTFPFLCQFVIGSKYLNHGVDLYIQFTTQTCIKSYQSPWPYISIVTHMLLAYKIDSNVLYLYISN